MKHRFSIRTLSILSLLLLTSCTPDSPLLDKGNGSAYCALPTRWSTVDKSYPPEVRLKEKTIEHIDMFWTDFKKSESQLALALDNMRGESGKANSDMVTSWMKEHLEYVDPAIEYEFGPIRGQQGHKLDFSTGGRDEVMPICKTLVAKAPKLPGWKFSAYRQALPLDSIAGGFKGRAGRDILPFEVSVNVAPQNKLDVIFVSPEFENDEEDNAKASRIISDLILGEENDDTWLGMITPKKGALMGQFVCAANADAYLKLFEAKKKEILASLPKTPYYKIADLGKAEEVHFGTKRNTMKTPLKKLGETLGAGGRFHSTQFSKCGDRFAYLKISKSKDFKTLEQLEPLQKELDAELKKAGAGCVFGIGLELPDTAYFDLALVDLEKAIPVLKSFSEKHKFSHESALRFYDADWMNEWVGMFEDTKKPTDLKKPWFKTQVE